ncbi:hypothetical protein [Herbaspirillum sp.]|nr:hypothetical protein [Herbaspirillum sp.]MBO9537738.1 hypothetical protein [Herbaspirillum sp.]
MFRIQLWLRKLAQRQYVWFLLLWLAGVLGMALLALPFHLLVMAAKS